jgi:hypothetical protein
MGWLPILDCHPEPARTRLNALLESGKSNVYAIENNGMKKLIYQAPWFMYGKCAGIVELRFEIPWRYRILGGLIYLKLIVIETFYSGYRKPKDLFQQ